MSRNDSGRCKLWCTQCDALQNLLEQLIFLKSRNNQSVVSIVRWRLGQMCGNDSVLYNKGMYGRGARALVVENNYVYEECNLTNARSF